MRKKGYKGRCEKKNLSKSMDVCRSYDAIQSVYADILQQDENIQEMFCWMAYPKETSKTCINVTIILYKTTYIYLFSFFTK